MSDKNAHCASLLKVPTDGQQSSARVIAVGDPSEWTKDNTQSPSQAMIFIAYHEVSEAVLSIYNPEMIVSPALARDFDCIELAILLHTLGFTGAYRAVASDLPNPQLIEKEVKLICPNLNFKIATLI